MLYIDVEVKCCVSVCVFQSDMVNIWDSCWEQRCAFTVGDQTAA